MKQWQNPLYLANLVFILIFAAWAKPQIAEGFWYTIYKIHWPITFVLLVILAYMLIVGLLKKNWGNGLNPLGILLKNSFFTFSGCIYSRVLDGSS